MSASIYSWGDWRPSNSSTPKDRVPGDQDQYISLACNFRVLNSSDLGLFDSTEKWVFSTATFFQVIVFGSLVFTVIGYVCGGLSEVNDFPANIPQATRRVIRVPMRLAERRRRLSDLGSCQSKWCQKKASKNLNA